MGGGKGFCRVERNFLTTKYTKGTKFEKIIIRILRVLRDLRGENSFSFDPDSVSLVILVILVSALIMPSSPQECFAATAPITIRVGYPQPSGAQLPLWVMSEAKLDRKYGFDLQNIYISGDARLTQTLVAGDIDMATTGGAVVNAVLSGADLVYIALIVPTYGFSVYARADVRDISSLKGKVVGVMTKGASADHGMIAVLRHNHLAPGQDVKFLYRKYSGGSERSRPSQSGNGGPQRVL